MNGDSAIMHYNPFSAETFSACWLKHFNQGDEGTLLAWIEPLTFVKHPQFPYLINTGSRFTKGVSYKTDPDSGISGKEVCLVYDILTYNQPAVRLPKNAGRLVSSQYPGYLIDIKEYSSLQDFLQKKFSKSSRYKLTKYKKRLEAAFDIRYRMFWGEIEKGTYDELFTHFRQLLEKRFDEKQETNNNLAPDEWNFFVDVAYPMILEKSAGLFVVYHGATPIAITLNFMSENIVFDAITVFDIDYAKFHLGSVSVMGLIDWCIANGMEILDFSKGEYDYKKRWATREYRFEYHIFYNRGSVSSQIIAWMLVSYFRLKQKFRKWKLNEWLHKLTYRLNNKGVQTAEPKLNFDLGELLDEAPALDGKIEFGSPEYQALKPALFEFLYLHSEDSKQTEIFQLRNEPLQYLFRGPNKQVIVRLEAI